MSKFTPGESLAKPTYSGPKDGIFVRKHTIVSANIKYDTKVAPTWNKSSILMTLMIKPKGQEWEKEIKLFGDYKVTTDGEIVDEGTTWRVWDLVRKLAQKHDVDCSYNADGKMTGGDSQATIEGDFKAFNGLEVWALAYPGYKKKEGDDAGFSTWNRLYVQFDAQDDDSMQQMIRDAFIKQVADGWEKKYQPWLLDEWDLLPELRKSAEFTKQLKEAGITLPGKATVDKLDAGGEADDDLPF